ncbi:MAG: hypothetical protein AB2A00_04805 [Myxococcota bacterium]
MSRENMAVYGLFVLVTLAVPLGPATAAALDGWKKPAASNARDVTREETVQGEVVALKRVPEGVQLMLRTQDDVLEVHLVAGQDVVTGQRITVQGLRAMKAGRHVFLAERMQR